MASLRSLKRQASALAFLVWAHAVDFEQAPDDFGYVVFDRTDRDADARRFYMIAWQATLLDDGAVVRTFGRKGRWKRVITTPFPSLQVAWPFIRATVKTRLRHHYRIVESGQIPSILVTSPVRSQRLVVCGGSSLAKDGQIGYH